MQPAERLLNLLILLLNAGRPLTFDEIRDSMGVYDQADRETAKRQFERDKDVLRDIGVAIELEDVDIWGGEQGYVVGPEGYELPEVSFSPDEVAALFVAAHATDEDPEASQAFGKLVQGPDAPELLGLVERGPSVGVEVPTPNLRTAAAAALHRRRIAFTYRSAAGEPGDREVDAWGLLFSRGAWYLVGNDRGKGEVRVFRLSRVTSEIEDVGEADSPPEGFDPREHFLAGPWGRGDPEVTARVAFSPKVGPWAVAQAPHARVTRTRRDGWVEAEIPATRADAFVSWVLSFGPDAELLAPRPLRQELVRRLEAVRASL